MAKRSGFWAVLILIPLAYGVTANRSRVAKKDLELKRRHAAIVVSGWKYLQTGDLEAAASYFQSAVVLDPNELMGRAGLNALHRYLEPGNGEERAARLEADYRTVLHTLMDSARGGIADRDYARVFRYTEMYLLLAQPTDDPRSRNEATVLREQAKHRLGLGA